MQRPGIRAWAGLALLSLPTALLGLDVTVLYLVLPSLAADLEPTAAQTLWIMDAYGLLIAGFLVTMGSLGDRVGRRRLLVAGAVAFGLFSVLAAYAPSAEWLIAARALLGVAGATLMPSTLALIGTLFPDPRDRALAIGVWATVFALGMAAGPVVGGALLAHLPWGSVFLVAVPVAAVVAVAAPVLLPEYRAPRAAGFDLPGVALSLGALLPLVHAVKHLAVDGPDPWTLAAALAGTVCAVLFVRRQLRSPAPLLDVSLFADRAFSAALVVLLVGLVGVGGAMFLVTQYLQLVEGLAATEAGLWMGPPALAMLAAAVGAPLAARRIRPGTVMAATLAASLGGYALLAAAGPGDRLGVVLGFALVYLGLGAIAALGTDIVVGAAPAERAGSAAAVSETVQELGLALGVVLLGGLAGAVHRQRVVPPEGVSADVAARAGEGLSGVRSVADRLPDATVQSAVDAFVAGLNLAALATGPVIAVLAVVCAAALRHVGPIGAPAPADR
ncbi:MFS transporter [Nocardiopsis flavescens]|uniref:MFS transporter n=1 Tax=Nocardiopsis flavescens TaxID=758803 RepID=UPI0036640420